MGCKEMGLSEGQEQDIKAHTDLKNGACKAKGRPPNSEMRKLQLKKCPQYS